MNNHMNVFLFLFSFFFFTIQKQKERKRNKIKKINDFGATLYKRTWNVFFFFYNSKMSQITSNLTITST